MFLERWGQTTFAVLRNFQTTETSEWLACFIYFNTEISVMGRTEISVSTLHYRNFCVKVDETSLRSTIHIFE